MPGVTAKWGRGRGLSRGGESGESGDCRDALLGVSDAPFLKNGFVTLGSFNIMQVGTCLKCARALPLFRCLH